MKTYEEIRKISGLDAQDRAWLKHKAAARDKWIREYVERKALEVSAGVGHDWSGGAKAHADRLNAEIERSIAKATEKGR